MYKIPANTVFIGKNLVYVPECHSTNSLAIELCQKNLVAEGTTVITDNQTHGRGQRGNSWFSDEKRNLTLSVVLAPAFLKPLQQFNLTIAMSLAIRDFLTQRISGHVKIKWPNDVLVNEMKICGMLIENILSGDTIQTSVVGIGLNVNQNSFVVDTATSMQMISGKEFNLPDELSLLLKCVEVRYLQLRDGKALSLREEYLSVLFGRRETRIFATPNHSFTGRIEGIDEYGKLLIEKEGLTHAYDLKEIRIITSNAT